MTDERMRMAIALEMGFLGCVDASCAYRNCQHLHKAGSVYFPEPYTTSMYPDYPNDLNAMHEAEAGLKHVTNSRIDQQVSYANTLFDILAASKGSVPFNFDVAHATARQRAEAFLRTIGKWKDGQ